MNIDYCQFIHALSDTIDLVGVDEVQHGKRVGCMAEMCCRVMGESEERTVLLYRAGLLHDCGVSSTKVHKNLVNELEWAESDLHCRIGADRMLQFAPLACFSDLIRYHHTRWQNLEKKRLPEQLKSDANLIFLLDRVDALAAMQPHVNRLAIRSLLCDKIGSLRGTYFKPELVDGFIAAAETEAFWITQESLHLSEYIRKRQGLQDAIQLDDDQLVEMALIFASIVDAKSPYTAEHSIGVASMSVHLAGRLGLSQAKTKQIRVAALLHDLGKLQVPDTILDHAGGLEGDSLAIMRHHSYVTRAILSKIKGLEDIADWAANHHEKLDGSGYPFRLGSAELSLEARIIMVADIFQALAQNRPYRSPMPIAEIMEVVTGLASRGKLDPEVVAVVAREPEACHTEATRPIPQATANA